MGLRALVTTPASIRSTTASLMSPEWTPRSCLSPRAASTASGVPPTPNCIVAPSGTRAATWAAMARSWSDGTRRFTDASGRSSGTVTSRSSLASIVSPKVYGTCGLTSAIVVRAVAMAAGT